MCWMRARCLADQNGDETLFRLMFVDITVVVIVIALDLWPHSSVWTLECFLHAEPSPVSPIFLHCVISRMCIQMKREKRWHSFPLSLFHFLSSTWTRAPCIGCVVTAIQDSCTGSVPTHPCVRALRGHKSPFLHHLPTTHIHVTVSSLLLPLHPVVLEQTLLFPLFPYIPSACLSPSPPSDPLSLQLCVSCWPVPVYSEMKLKCKGSAGKTAWPLCFTQLSLPLQTSTYH